VSNCNSHPSLDDEIERRLLAARRIFFADAVMPETAADTIRKLWYLELEAPGKPITLVISSPGGSIDAGFAIWDQAKMLTSPLTTVVTGLAASMGSILSLCAPRGRRFATENARIMIHQPSISDDLTGQATDLAIQAREILRTRDRIVEIYVEATGKDKNTIGKAIDRDTWMTAQEAKDYGLIDRIVKSYADIDAR
jgi:ATP-dependent Clp protease protease subunit